MCSPCRPFICIACLDFMSLRLRAFVFVSYSLTTCRIEVRGAACSPSYRWWCTDTAGIKCGMSFGVHGLSSSHCPIRVRIYIWLNKCLSSTLLQQTILFSCYGIYFFHFVYCIAVLNYKLLNRNFYNVITFYQMPLLYFPFYFYLFCNACQCLAASCWLMWTCNLTVLIKNNCKIETLIPKFLTPLYFKCLNYIANYFIYTKTSRSLL